MIGNTFTANFHLHGTLSANAILRYTVPVDATLISVSSIGTANVTSALIVGTAADDDGYIKTHAPGANNTLVVKGRGDFDGDLNSNPAECPRIAAGTTLLLTYTHASASNVAITLHFME